MPSAQLQPYFFTYFYVTKVKDVNVGSRWKGIPDRLKENIPCRSARTDGTTRDAY